MCVLLIPIKECSFWGGTVLGLQKLYTDISMMTFKMCLLGSNCITELNITNVECGHTQANEFCPVKVQGH